ncbi:hypothetical protein BDB00DRAFT_786697 [Zychaea mexicana]|uniref:uncharacterized protein n=1 Tax=Zychaea mexicana TaxID=64656 RepID=UPI0022FE10FC|nr:uncharacterized protein BDB00DRAFT_786697 [Zychaea mexicana]KAI9495118.1 hypothetical protein BDB00DRAFT_786697 [Zychaea mexicana]
MSPTPPSQYALNDAVFSTPSLPPPPQSTLPCGRPRRASMTPGMPTETWYSDKYNPTQYPLHNYCINCSTQFVADHTYKRHLVDVHKVRFEPVKPGPKKTISGTLRILNKRQNERKRALAKSLVYKGQRRDEAAKKYLNKLVSLIGAESWHHAYLKMFEHIDATIDQIENEPTIAESRKKFGDCWKYAVYKLCALEGRSVFDPTYEHFFGNLFMEDAYDAYSQLSGRDTLSVNDAVRNALSDRAPKFLANYGPKFRAFRWIGNPLLMRATSDCGIERGNATDDDDHGDGDRVSYSNILRESREKEWARLLYKRHPASLEAGEGVGGEGETEEDCSTGIEQSDGYISDDDGGLERREKDFMF